VDNELVPLAATFDRAVVSAPLTSTVPVPPTRSWGEATQLPPPVRYFPVTEGSVARWTARPLEQLRVSRLNQVVVSHRRAPSSTATTPQGSAASTPRASRAHSRVGSFVGAPSSEHQVSAQPTPPPTASLPPPPDGLFYKSRVGVITVCQTLTDSVEAREAAQPTPFDQSLLLSPHDDDALGGVGGSSGCFTLDAFPPSVPAPSRDGLASPHHRRQDTWDTVDDDGGDLVQSTPAAAGAQASGGLPPLGSRRPSLRRQASGTPPQLTPSLASTAHRAGFGSFRGGRSSTIANNTFSSVSKGLPPLRLRPGAPAVGHDFAFKSKLLVQLHINLRGVQQIGDNFCRECPSLVDVVLTNTDSLREIGDGCFYRCTALERVDLGRPRRLRRIGSWFLYHCVALKSLDVSSCVALRHVGDGWLRDCTALWTFSTAGLKSLRTVGDGWLSSCTRLNSVDCEDLVSLEFVGNGWMEHCAELAAVNFHEMPKLESVGHWWLYHCGALISVKFAAFSALRTIGDRCLAQCASLIGVSFHGLDKLISVGDEWLRECSLLPEVTCEGLRALQSVGNGWLEACAALQAVDCAGLSNLCVVGDAWMARCPSLAAVNFAANLTNLRAVGFSWLEHCTALPAVDFGLMPRLETVGNAWLARCTALTFARFGGLKALITIGPQWMRDCRALSGVEPPPNLVASPTEDSDELGLSNG
jgi:hypothetical protein